VTDIHEKQMSEFRMKSRRVEPAYSIKPAFPHRIGKIGNTFMTPLLVKTQELTVIRVILHAGKLSLGIFQSIYCILSAVAAATKKQGLSQERPDPCFCLCGFTSFRDPG
jgi:hypothetical protein